MSDAENKNTGTETLTVDVDRVLRDKNPRLHRWLPRFVISYLKRIVHEDEVNYVLTNFSHLEPVEFIRATLNYMDISYSAVGVERIDPNGRYIFASNHPFGGLDGMMLAEELTRHFGPTRLIVNDILMNLKPLAPLFIPVNKHGRQSGEYARRFREAFDSDVQIATFPAGLCSRRIDGVVQDVRWKDNFVKMAVESRRDVVPTFFEGRLSRFFYNLHSVRTFLGIKANIEMLFLADEMFAQKGRHCSIVFGEPVRWQDIAAGGGNAHWCKTIRTNAYNLKKELAERRF